MAKLYFYYASMNAGKSATLLQANFNYNERGMRTMLWTAALDDRGSGRDGGHDGERDARQVDAHAIESRIGLHAGAHRFTADTDLYERVTAAHAAGPLSCILIDEAQFLAPEQVWQCAHLADKANIPVLCYGLRTDFQGQLFPGSAVLLGIADSLVELKGVCHCGRKASMNVRVDGTGAAVSEGAQTEIGGNERYVALCRRHFSEALGR
ncbi:thymidine kinase [Novosphingobium profundi]|uniref:thymidine kinase n=1 Tax=Novosphingobium profundi TaxID=1774954 RepID=UPI001BD99C25|nr:thymidine kinase [Novosphingobium profundi]MBT0669787.1 thymidine kinase [Novosphingobium profundi]